MRVSYCVWCGVGALQSDIPSDPSVRQQLLLWQTHHEEGWVKVGVIYGWGRTEYFLQVFFPSGFQRQERRAWNYFIPRNYKGEALCCRLTYFELREGRVLSTSPLWPVAKCIISALTTQAKCQSLKPSAAKSIFLGLNRSQLCSSIIER